MYRVIFLLLTAGFLSFALADTASQTNWSGGPGVWGPVESQWSDEFYVQNKIQYDFIGCLSLRSIRHTVESQFSWAVSVYSADINSDGYMDVLATGWLSGAIAWWENTDGSGINWIKHTIDGNFNGAYSVYSEDIDSDGYLDVLGAAYQDDAITWWENADGSGTSWIEHTVCNDFNGARSVYSEDIDGDGYMDILGAAYHDDAITWWENADGSGTNWIAHNVNSNFNGVCAVYSEDINCDGYMDVLGAAFEDCDITWWENVDGSGGNWIEHTIDGNFNGAYSVYSEDIDSDGYLDVLGAAYQDDAITWWENADGSGTSWIEHTVCNDFDGARSVYSEDIDGDGYMDILGAAQDDGDITWWENSDTSPGIYWTEHMVIGEYYSARSVYSEDVDGDGNMEILGVSHNSSGDISWWEPLEYTSDGFLESSCLYLGNDPGWGSIDWTCNVPTGTSVSFQVRSCDSPDISEMGAWSDTLYSPGSLSGILDEHNSFFQYRAILNTTDSCETSVLEDVTITWDPVGIEEGEATELRLLTVAPNPSSGFSVLRFYLPVSASVKLNVFDLSGRIVQETHEDEYSAGYHDVQLEDLLPGIYFCRMTAGEFTATQRFVVIK